MLPDGYEGLVVCDTRRALEWEAGLQRAGFAVVRVETRGADADKGDWQIGVPRSEAGEARKLVSEVIRGDRVLPRKAVLPRMAWFGLAGVALVLLALLVIGWLTG